MPKITQKAKARKLFNTRMKAIRPFVDFNYNLNDEPTSAAKKKVKRYYDEIEKLQSRPNQVYRPRRADRLRGAKKFAQQDDSGYPSIKVAFIPSDGGKRGTIEWTPRGIKLKKKNVEITDLSFDPDELVDGGEGYVADMLESDEGLRYTINAGEFSIPIPYTYRSLPRAVVRLMMKYGGTEIPTEYEKGSRHWVWWMNGAKAIRPLKQDGVKSYVESKAKSIARGKKERKAKKRKAARK